AELLCECLIGVGFLGCAYAVGHRYDQSCFDAVHGSLLLHDDQGVQKSPGVVPLPAVFLPPLSSRLCDGVVPAAGAGTVLPPVGGDETALLQPLEGGVQRGLLEAVLSAGALLDGLVDLISVIIPPHELGEDDGIRVAPQGIR